MRLYCGLDVHGQSRQFAGRLSHVPLCARGTALAKSSRIVDAVDVGGLLGRMSERAVGIGAIASDVELANWQQFSVVDMQSIARVKVFVAKAAQPVHADDGLFFFRNQILEQFKLAALLMQEIRFERKLQPTFVNLTQRIEPKRAHCWFFICLRAKVALRRVNKFTGD